VWPFRVVRDSPGLNLRAGTARHEVMGVESLVVQLAIEAFAVGVLGGLAGLNVVPPNPMLIRPLVERLSGELGSMVGDDFLRQPRVRSPTELLSRQYEQRGRAMALHPAHVACVKVVT
jgi:hypothetical protein